MRPLILILIVCITFLSCKKEDQTPVCHLTKFITTYPATNLIHHDLVRLKDNRIEMMYSYDLKNAKDTSGRIKIFYEYNTLGKLLAFRDESNTSKISRFDLTYNSSGLVTKSTQTTNGVINDEIVFEYDAQNRPISALGLRLLGVNRSIEYDVNGNPYRIYRSDYGSLPTLNEHTFDNNRNFFEGIPEIRIYWLIRPLYAFLPFGGNNIQSTKFFTLQGTELKEVPELRTIREVIVNEQGFPNSMKIMLENQNKILSAESKFEYNCQ
ncbi:hypothetical protein [Emticicia sp. SJ17W-69]|uniref:hypothetical protein n=1 Tax=Emticicia sp. SJ17W-69 TaxID=3421657 RepID=UPI003EB6A46D